MSYYESKDLDRFAEISVGYDGRLYDCDFNQMLDRSY
jgi:hypothetical protein